MDNPTGARADAPYCYRHPDRETYISCQRCGRPICPDCMRQASVGFQCPECIAEGARSVRQSRTVAGGLVPHQVGLVSFILIGINVVAFLAQLATGGNSGAVTHWGEMLSDSRPDYGDSGARIYLTGVADGAWWRIVVSGFLHLGYLHIALNMYALYLFGPMLERMLGHVRFITMYLTSLVGGSLFVYALAPRLQPTLGASGAIFGLLGCALVVFLKRKYDVRFLVALLAINAVFSVLVSGISWQAHLGGFLIGALSGAAFMYAPKMGRTYIQAGFFGLLWFLMMVAFITRTAQFPG